MKNNIVFLLIVFSIFCANSQNNDDKTKVLFSAYTTAKNGLNYRKESNMNSEILGKFEYGTKVNVIDNSKSSYFFVEDNKRGALHGKWIGVRKDSSLVYVFSGYLFESSDEIEKHIKIIDDRLEVVYGQIVDLSTNQKLLVDKHIQTSNHLADYLCIKLQINNQIVYSHKIDYLFKNSYDLERTNDIKPTFNYSTIFDECPSMRYSQTFSVIDNRVLKINEEYYEADEE